MQATNTRALHDALATAIRGITPRVRPRATWHHTPRAREEALEGDTLRNFFLISSGARRTDPPLFYGQGTSYGYQLEIHTSYTAVDDLSIDSIIDDDGVDLDSTFHGLFDPTTPGLYSAEYAGRTPETINDDGQVTVVHLFDIIYNQED